MVDKQLAFADFVADLGEVNPGAEPRTFDRMMFDVCGEVNHIRLAMDQNQDGLDDALQAFERSCERIYESPSVSIQRKYSLRAAQWILKSWCEWGMPELSAQSATRWFDAWQRERNMTLLQL